jgi:SAM-dependent methyltransferase
MTINRIMMNGHETQESNPITDEVQAFYDKHPYPSPVTDLEQYRRLGQDQAWLRADYHLLWPATTYRAGQEILVAGCGTSQAAKYALRQPTARVVGIDVSSTSLRHTKKLKRKYNLANLDIYQLPIERVHELECSFDKIICTGVLHHLADPDTALRALRTVLKPDGAMQLMVYAPYGRTGIYMLQEYCRRLEIGTSDKEIRDLVAVLKILPHGHPLEHLLRQAPDFQRVDALADALLHPQDRAYSVPQLFDFIERSDLTFGRWVRQAPYLPQCGDPARSPHRDRLVQLPAPEQYAAVELFRGTMVRHSAIVYRNDRPGDGRPVRFDDERWQDYVPLRQPYTICVQKQLPPGAAGVLINQSHTYPDLILPINAQEKRLFEAIDGKGTIAEITKSVLRANNDQSGNRVRAFFERLWWYDQVVFDASKQSERCVKVEA